MWLIKRLRLCIYKVDYYATILTEDMPTEEPGENTSRLTTKELAEQAGLLLDDSPANKEAKKSRPDVGNSDEMLCEYARCYYRQKNKGSFDGENDVVVWKKRFVKSMEGRGLVKMFMVRLLAIRKDEKRFWGAMIQHIRKFKEMQDKSPNVPQLICRICEQSMTLDRYIVSGVIGTIIGAHRPVPETCGVQEEIPGGRRLLAGLRRGTHDDDQESLARYVFPEWCLKAL